MNLVFVVLLLTSWVTLLVTNPSGLLPAMIEGAEGAIQLCVKLLAIYSVWLSVLKIMEKTRLDAGLSRLLHPVIRRLFKGESEDSYKWLSLNMASNMLGMGGASTPAGIEAMRRMERDGKSTANMSLLVVISATSIQLIPATVIALRASAGSLNPSSIILPTLISSTIATAVGVILTKIFCNKKSTQGALRTAFDGVVRKIKDRSAP